MKSSLCSITKKKKKKSVTGGRRMNSDGGRRRRVKQVDSEIPLKLKQLNWREKKGTDLMEKLLKLKLR